MARIHDPIPISAGMPVPTLGLLLGNRVSQEVFQQVNSRPYESFFGAEFDHMRQEFIDRHVTPMMQLETDLNKTVNYIMNPNQYRILDTIADFQSIPECMELAIALFEPVKRGIMEGRMEGFGFIPESLPEEDVYGRMLDNFSCDDVEAASDEDGYYPISATMYSDDPVLTDDEQYAIRKTRQFILNRILKDTDRDPTAIELPRG